MTEHELDIKHKSIAAITSMGVHGFILLLLIFVFVWHAPDPPITGAGGAGFVLNYGASDEGSGDVPPEQEVGSAGTQPEEPAKSEPEKSETQREDQPQQEVKATETKAEEKDKIEGTEDIEKKKDEPKEVEKQKEKTPEKTTEVKKETEVKQKANTQSVYDPNKKSGTTDSKSTDAKAGNPGSEGDDKGKTGDKGKPEGTLAKGGQYTGKAGSGGPGEGGSGGVSMSGFNGFEWPRVDAPSVPDEAYGVYEFLVKVDDQGDVISVTPLQRGLSLEAERKFKEVIQKLTFIPKGSNLPAQSEGKITFKVISK